MSFVRFLHDQAHRPLRLRLATAAAAAMIATPALAGTASPPLPGGGEISVLTYNVHGLPWPLSSGRPTALREIGDELSEMRRDHREPDIVLIQEGFTGSVARLIRTSGYAYWAQGPGRSDRVRDPALKGAMPKGSVHHPEVGEGWGKFTGAGLYILSNYPIVHVETQAYKFCAGWDCLANKGVMLAQIAIPGLPEPIDVVNTHLNSRHAARVPVSWSIQAYATQVAQLRRFIDSRRTAASPLLVGGDFNVKGAPDRYSLLVRDPESYSTVSQYCVGAASCRVRPFPADSTPWLDSQDLQAFGGAGGVAVCPTETERMFDGAVEPKLSDHDGYLVRYRLSWGGGVSPCGGPGGAT
jgi:endonuclease/exonuclease/phosphatase family metal-dependent hydrolase